MNGQEIHNSAGRLALAALSAVATGVAVNSPSNAIASETYNSPQPVVFMSQSPSYQIVTGEKLEKYEASLIKNLGKDGANLRNNGCTCSGGCADDCG
ncbi:hypothetical protein [Brasilonema sp. UFV-L1]|uniref:hypothetical protein n=1 Tax=Brasilonema sp. UFV-L1 TaxID=2234130 RepID=UPI00145DFD7D|nr:hypothetical protein [Brasilonema sp. UFV-L1]NMG09223.1 hypothetical protein [Brasilonema sp. UFV-L1]